MARGNPYRAPSPPSVRQTGRRLPLQLQDFNRELSGVVRSYGIGSVIHRDDDSMSLIADKSLYHAVLRSPGLKDDLLRVSHKHGFYVKTLKDSRILFCPDETAGKESETFFQWIAGVFGIRNDS